MKQVECVLIEKCELSYSDKCLRCIYNRKNTVLSDFFVERKPHTKEEIPNIKEAECSDTHMDDLFKVIDNQIIDKLLIEKYGINPRTVQGMMIKQLAKDIKDGNSETINKFIRDEDKDKIYQFINFSKSLKKDVIRKINNERKCEPNLGVTNIQEEKVTTIPNKIDLEKYFEMVERQILK